MLDATSLLQVSWKRYQLIIGIVFTGYLILVRILRYRRMANIKASFGQSTRHLATMTTKEAHEIIAQLQELEFPYAFAKARKIALLKV